MGESTLSALKTRPDYAVKVRNGLVGFIEVKAPGKGADPRKFKDDHDRAQWDKLKSLPNLIYTDGNGFSLWRDGKLHGEIVKLDGDVESAGAKLAAPPALERLFSDFLRWEPIAPTSARALAEISAGLSRCCDTWWVWLWSWRFVGRMQSAVFVVHPQGGGFHPPYECHSSPSLRALAKQSIFQPTVRAEDGLLRKGSQ